ncbi:hypothetical protein DFJ63DRAFT_257951 [Scheffersomyces coipomensis]|uniref:uncharacterized protein n=1 Tax=Scheffersomyces coipomensis TaxID=1788519 RepID=UPI00315D8657
MSTFMDKENPQTPTRLHTRKSYSILTPVSNVSSYSPNLKSLNASKLEKERIISESTGLVKFSLASNSASANGSPNRSNTSSTLSSPKKLGLPVYIPIQEKPEQPQVELKPTTALNNSQTDYHQIEQELLDQYTQKQKELLKFEKQIELVKFELLEISTKLENCKREERIQNLKDRNNHETDFYKQIHSQTTAQLSQIKIIKSPPSSPLKFSQNSNFPSIDVLKKKASFIVEKNFKNELESVSKMFNTNTTASTSPNELSTKTSKFFNEVLENFSPKKTNENLNKINNTFNNTINNIQKNILSKNFPIKSMTPTSLYNEEDLINSSFTFENLSMDHHTNDHLNVIYETSDVTEDDDDTGISRSEIVDIDDYNSSFEDDE